MTETTERHRWAAVVLVMLGTFMVVLDTTIVNVALPQIARDFGVGRGIEWVVTGYLLAMGVAQTTTGWVAARFGDRSAFLGSLGLFAVCSAIAAASPNLVVLILTRAIQGVFGGLAVPLSGGILFAMFPRDRRGQAIGLSATVVMAAPAFGPLLSGYVVTNYSWRWLLLVNVPVGLGGLLLGLRLVPEAEGPRPRRLDIRGLVLVATGLVLLLVSISNVNEWGWSSVRFVGMLAASAALLAAYSWHSRRIDHPLIEPGIFTEPVFRLTILITWSAAAAQFARLVFIPLELQVVRGMTAFGAGLILAVGALGSAATMPMAGRMSDRLGGRTPTAAGALVLGVSMFLLSILSTDTPTWHVVLAVALTGVGVTMVTMPTTVTGLNWVAHRLGDRVVSEAAAVRNLHRQLAGAVVTASLAVVVTANGGRLGPVNDPSPALLDTMQAAYNRVYVVGIGGAVLAFLFALRLPRGLPPEGPASAVDDGGGVGLAHASSLPEQHADGSDGEQDREEDAGEGGVEVDGDLRHGERRRDAGEPDGGGGAQVGVPRP